MNLDKIFYNHGHTKSENGTEQMARVNVHACMKEAVRQALELASEKATVSGHTISTENGLTSIESYINKKSILDVMEELE